MPLNKFWEKLRSFKLDQLCPDKIKSITFQKDCCEGKVGSFVTIVYTDDTVWNVRLTEISDRKFTIAYEVLTSEPELTFTGMTGEFKLIPITMTNECVLTWTTEYSNDCDVQVIQDSKFKKQEFFDRIQI